MVPIPLVPPWTSSVSPSVAQPRSNTLCHTVNSVSGSAAASASGRPVGHRQAMVGDGEAVLRHSRRRSPARRPAARAAPRRPRPRATTRAGDLEPGNVRRARRRRIAAEPLQHVGPVDPGEGDLDQHLARTRAAEPAALEPQHLGPARLGDSNRLASSAGSVTTRCTPVVPVPRSPALVPAPIDSKQGRNHPALRWTTISHGSRGDAASRLAREPLDTYSQDELMERIALLEAEIERVRAHHAQGGQPSASWPTRCSSRESRVDGAAALSPPSHAPSGAPYP